MANEIYSKSWWGKGACNDIGWGIVYQQYAGCSAVPDLLLALQLRATYFENAICTTATLTRLENIE
tara:strand:- start:39 stop:236 length:198 start_codon:yes stop_codon:yes gene_type:complete